MVHIILVRLWPVLLTIPNLVGYWTGRIAPDERVIFFPTSASKLNTTHWQVPIHGWIFQPKQDSKKRIAFRLLLRRALMMKVPSSSSSHSSEEERRILDRRIQSFVVDNERWKRPKITLGTQDYTMLPSSKNGHFQQTLRIAEQDLLIPSSSLQDPAAVANSVVEFFALSHDGRRKYPGKVHLVPPTGITILSDIDDTIKITNVTGGKTELLRNTFLREFQAVPGMSDVYQKWWCSSSCQNVQLHLLSASVYQLYEDLEDFRQRCQFPPATYSLKTVRPKQAPETIQTVLLEDPLQFKRRALKQLFHTYPQRQFVLVGDTGEKDPQVYASMAQEYPHQVLMICLRLVVAQADAFKKDSNNMNVPAAAAAAAMSRVEQVMKDNGIDNRKWIVFEDPSELMRIDLSKFG